MHQLTMSLPNPSQLSPHIANAMAKAEACGDPQAARAIERAEMLRQKRVAERKERKLLQNRESRRRTSQTAKVQQEEQKRQRVEKNLMKMGVAKDDFQGADLAAESVASLAGSVSGTKTCTAVKSSTSNFSQADTPTMDAENSTTSKAGCYNYIPLFDPNYFCGWCNCEKMSSWHYQLLPAVSIVPTNYFANEDDEDDSNDEEEEADVDAIPQDEASAVTVLSTPFKTAVDANAATVPAVVTPPDKLEPKIDPSPKIIALQEKGVDAATCRADNFVAKHFNSADPKAAVFGRKITRPFGDRNLTGKIVLSWYPPNFLPLLGDGNGSRRMRKEDIAWHSNRIIHVGKSIMQKQSEWNVEEAEVKVFGSSTKYHTLLLHDPTIRSIEKAGLSIVYFKPVATKYFWLSFVTTTMTARRVKKEDHGRGYGRMIMWRLINLARKADGIEEIYLEVNPEWTTAVDLYQSLGFEESAWDQLPQEIETFEFKVKASDNPECKKVEHETLFKHHEEYMLMRLKLSVFD